MGILFSGNFNFLMCGWPSYTLAHKTQATHSSLKGEGSKVSRTDCEVSLSSGTFHSVVPVFLRKKAAGSHDGWKV